MSLSVGIRLSRSPGPFRTGCPDEVIKRRGCGTVSGLDVTMNKVPSITYSLSNIVHPMYDD